MTTIDGFLLLNNPRIGERLKEVRKLDRLNQDDVSKLMEITRQTYIRYESWERVPDAEFLTKFISHFNINANWLLFGIENMRLFEEPGTIIDMNNFLLVPEIGAAACGQSGEVFEGDIKGFKAFEKRFLKKFHSPCLTRAKGDSMLPVIADGDLLLCDRDMNKRLHPDPKRMYLVNNPDEDDKVQIKVKKLSFSGRTLTLIPLNPAHPPVAVDVDGKSILDIVLGQIVWIGRELENDS
jgi:phage repressor protein C with HTH and peptisase S24 domain